MAPQRSVATGHAKAANGQPYGNQYNNKLTRHDSVEERFFCPPPEPPVVQQAMLQRRETHRPEPPRPAPLQLKELYAVKSLSKQLLALEIVVHGEAHYKSL